MKQFGKEKKKTKGKKKGQHFASFEMKAKQPKDKRMMKMLSEELELKLEVVDEMREEKVVLASREVQSHHLLVQWEVEDMMACCDALTLSPNQQHQQKQQQQEELQNCHHKAVVDIAVGYLVDPSGAWKLEVLEANCSAVQCWEQVPAVVSFSSSIHGWRCIWEDHSALLEMEHSRTSLNQGLELQSISSLDQASAACPEDPMHLVKGV